MMAQRFLNIGLILSNRFVRSAAIGQEFLKSATHRQSYVSIKAIVVRHSLFRPPNTNPFSDCKKAKPFGIP